jgi:4'-phosphopantetheinyl transferase
MAGTVVDVYWTDLDADGSDLGWFAGMLSANEHERARRFRFERDRQRYIVRRGRLRALLARYLDLPPPQVQLRVGPFGKPYAAEGNLRFSLSHSHGIALYAIAHGLEVGCDIEHRDQRYASEQLPELFFSPREVHTLRSLAPALQAEGFFNCWTRKEAYVKARGYGLSLPLDVFDVSLAPSEPAALLRGCAGWSVRAFEPVPSYHAAVVAQGENWRLGVQSTADT